MMAGRHALGWHNDPALLHLNLLPVKKAIKDRLGRLIVDYKYDCDAGSYDDMPITLYLPYPYTKHKYASNPMRAPWEEIVDHIAYI